MEKLYLLWIMQRLDCLTVIIKIVSYVGVLKHISDNNIQHLEATLIALQAMLLI